MGANEYRQEDDWPPPQAKRTKYFLAFRWQSEFAPRRRTLRHLRPESQNPPTVTLYNPGNPVPTVGGPLCCDGEHMEPGPRDQRSVENRDDVLVYSTGPLANDLEVTGPVTAELFVKSSAVDTDFTAKLVDVGPDGFAQDLTEGILRMRYGASREHVSLINPGQIYKITVDLWATSNVFLPRPFIAPGDFQQQFPAFRS